jgi:hypothetical protein
MSGAFHRAIQLTAGDGWASAEVEDDFHRFGVTVHHDGRQVTDVVGRAARYPWSGCPLAVEALAALRGLPVSPDPTAVYRFADARVQCTHLFEMTGLAVVQAARGPGTRRYDAAVTDPMDGLSVAELRRDGGRVLRWTLRGGTIETPSELAGLKPGEIRSSALRKLAPEAAEARLVLRRAASAAAARAVDIDAYPTAADIETPGACFVFRPGVAQQSARRYGSVRDFSAGRGPLAGAPSSGEA